MPWKRSRQEIRWLPVLPKPVQFPHPPVWYMGNHESEARFAAARGLTFLPFAGISMKRTEVLLSTFQTALHEAGRHLWEVEVPLIREVFVAETQSRAEELSRGPIMSLYERFHADGRLARWEGRAIHPDELNWEALLEDRVVVGSVETVAARLRDIQLRVGVRHILCHMAVPGMALEDVSSAMWLFQAEVWSRLQG